VKSNEARVRTEAPSSVEEAAEALRAAAAQGRRIRIRFSGGRTKLDWGRPVPEPDVELSTQGLDRIVEHNAADLTAVVEAGMRLADLQSVLADAGQMLAIDPPLGSADSATVGGVVATGDSGPLRHSYGAIRDLLLGITVVLSDGTVAKAGGKVIKNVAGYDLAKLFAGSFGTLGLVAQVAVRLHPIPVRRATATGSADDGAALGRAINALSRAPLEFESVDVSWRSGWGRVLARCGGAAAAERAGAATRLMNDAGLGEIVVIDDDESLWAPQRDGQRSGDGVVLKVSGLPSALARVVGAADRAGGSVVARACLGIAWISLPSANIEEGIAAVEDMRRALAGFPCVVLDAPPVVREKVDVWATDEGPDVTLMRRIKAQFDPAGACNPGVLVGGI
jgi:glycolate oxidase FAD binding subunit